ncbi:MAG: hypothetical protein IJH77_00095, partial [Mogibacterium sp.]|nr:hypothetical protein [Mogibacterium sp.]
MNAAEYEFYHMTDPEKRYELIRQGILSGEDAEAWNAREELFRARYRYDKGANRYLDCFMTAFLELLAENRRGSRKPGRFGKKQIRKA